MSIKEYMNDEMTKHLSAGIEKEKVRNEWSDLLKTEIKKKKIEAFICGMLFLFSLFMVRACLRHRKEIASILKWEMDERALVLLVICIMAACFIEFCISLAMCNKDLDYLMMLKTQKLRHAIEEETHISKYGHLKKEEDPCRWMARLILMKINSDEAVRMNECSSGMAGYSSIKLTGNAKHGYDIKILMDEGVFGTRAFFLHWMDIVQTTKEGVIKTDIQNNIVYIPMDADVEVLPDEFMEEKRRMDVLKIAGLI